MYMTLQKEIETKRISDEAELLAAGKIVLGTGVLLYGFKKKLRGKSMFFSLVDFFKLFFFYASMEKERVQNFSSTFF